MIRNINVLLKERLIEDGRQEVECLMGIGDHKEQCRRAHSNLIRLDRI